MNMQRIEFFWHPYHNSLLEWCDSYDKRKEFILESKPQEEQRTRLERFQRVKGELPDELVKAGEAYIKAITAEVYVYDAAWKAYEKAKEANMPVILALHEQECPNCPWNSKTIFPDSATG